MTWLPDQPKFTVGQRVIAKAGKLLGGYFGHVIEMDLMPPHYIVVDVKGRIRDSDNRNAGCIGRAFPFHDSELEAAD